MTDNVFAPPASKLEDRAGPEALWEMPFKEPAKLRNASINIRVLGFLFGLSAAGSLLLVGLGSFGAAASGRGAAGGMVFLAIFLVTGLLSLAACVGSYTRPRWGRVLGMITCALSLLNFPIGTLIGGLGLYAYYSGARLFGPDRFLHDDVSSIYKQRKAAKK
jgi:hypothetical protein